MCRGLLVASLVVSILHSRPTLATSAQPDIIESVAHALLGAPDVGTCIVLPDSLSLEITGTRPIRICRGPGTQVVREQSGRILDLTVHSRFGTRESAERAVDSIGAILVPILGTPRHCRWPLAWDWRTMKYHASIDVEANSDVVRPDNLWRAEVRVERKGGGQPCTPP
jgi:hypothetical protein